VVVNGVMWIAEDLGASSIYESNMSLAINLIEWAAGNTDLVEMRSRGSSRMVGKALNTELVKAAEGLPWVLNIVVPTLVIAALGILLWYQRESERVAWAETLASRRRAEEAAQQAAPLA
jgi:hypothetical protein